MTDQTKKGPDGDSSATGPNENQPTHEQESRMHIVAHTTDADGQVSGMNDTPDLFAYLAEVEQQRHAEATRTLAETDPATVDADDIDDDQALTLPEKFVRFHHRNRHLLAALERRVDNWYRSTGGRKTGVEMFLSSLRYDMGIATRDDQYKVNNSYAAFYTRLLVHRHPEWADMFEMRRSVADRDLSWLDEVAA